MTEKGIDSIIFELVTRGFNLIFIDNRQTNNKIPQLVLNSFSHILKFNEPFEIDSPTNCRSYETAINNCLEFFTFMCKHDISFVYTQRNHILKYLDKMNDKLTALLIDNQSLARRYGVIEYVTAGLNLIENLIKYWSFEIYYLLGRDGINAFIERCKLSIFEHVEEFYESDENEFKLITNNISNEIFKYKTSLRKFYVVNGYPKKLN